MQKALTAMVAVLLLGVAGCAIVTPYVSSMNYSPETLEILGTGEGESYQGYLLCFVPTRDAYSMMSAIKTAISSRGGDALINTVAEHETVLFLGLYCQQEIRVRGTVVKFKHSHPQQQESTSDIQGLPGVKALPATPPAK